MTKPILTWQTIDTVAERLGAKYQARYKWRSRGIPAEWRITIAAELVASGMAFAITDFCAFDHIQSDL